MNAGPTDAGSSAEPSTGTASRLEGAATTRERLLTAGMQIVNEMGLDVGLGRLSFEEVIQRADVARASAYRQWPTRQAFVEAIIVELARGLHLSTGFTQGVPALVAQMLGDGSGLASPQGRRNQTVDLVRLLAIGDFDSMLASKDWNLYTALSAAAGSLSSPQLRSTVTEALLDADRRRTEARAHFYAQFAALAGYRLRVPLSGPSGFLQISEAAGAVFTGFLIRATYDPGVSVASLRLRAFEMSEPRLWSPLGYAATSTVFAHLEPDPGIEWSPQRISDLLLTDLNALF